MNTADSLMLLCGELVRAANQGTDIFITIGEKNSNNKHESTKTRKPENNNVTMGRSLEQVSADIIGAALAVHRELGPGFLESIYDAAMRVSLRHRSIPFQSQFPVSVSFEGEVVGDARIDLLVAEQVILGLKAVESLRDIHFVQLKSYLRATGLQVGLLFNFNASTLVIKRIVLHR
jgi:GxxExxY protein